jgi:hypothetical protein
VTALASPAAGQSSLNRSRWRTLGPSTPARKLILQSEQLMGPGRGGTVQRDAFQHSTAPGQAARQADRREAAPRVAMAALIDGWAR